MFKHLFISKFVYVAATVATLALSTLPADAGEVYNREAAQEARIRQGVASGQLTQREYNRDQNHLNAINAQRNAELRANGGHLTSGEYHQLNRELNRNSTRIYDTKHNGWHQSGY